MSYHLFVDDDVGDRRIRDRGEYLRPQLPPQQLIAAALPDLRREIIELNLPVVRFLLPSFAYADERSVDSHLGSSNASPSPILAKKGLGFGLDRRKY